MKIEEKERKGIEDSEDEGAEGEEGDEGGDDEDGGGEDDGNSKGLKREKKEGG